MTRPLYCDESVWIPVADGLRRRGWEVHTARQHDRLGTPDREQLSFAAGNDWLLLTFDDGFLTLVERNGLILYLNQAGMRIGDVVKRVDGYLDELSDDGRQIHYL